MNEDSVTQFLDPSTELSLIASRSSASEQRESDRMQRTSSGSAKEENTQENTQERLHDFQRRLDQQAQQLAVFSTTMSHLVEEIVCLRELFHDSLDARFERALFKRAGEGVSEESSDTTRRPALMEEEKRFSAGGTSSSQEMPSLPSALPSEGSLEGHPLEEPAPLRDAFPSGRRAFLKGAGTAAIAAALAGGVLVTEEAVNPSQTAQAATGDNLVLGKTNDAGQTTYLVPTQGTTPGILWYAFNTTSTGDGMQGASEGGYGVLASSSTGVDLYAFGTGRIQQFLQPFTGAPTAADGTYTAGEQIRDQQGDLFICVASGSPGTWKKVSSLTPGYPGGAVMLLPTPIRVYDSRTTSILQAGTARSVQITGVMVNLIQVPPGATGVIGNLTVTQATGSGFLTLAPAGAAPPSTSALNYLTNQTVANNFTVGLSSSGQVTLRCFGSSTQFILDISGFIS